MIEVVRIAGLMRSGSNLLTWVLRHNFAGVETATMLLGWKHGPVIRDRRELALDDYVDPRYRGELRRFVAERPADWARVVASPLYQAAVAAQREQSFAVALAVRDPALWYASCVRVAAEAPGFLNHEVTPGGAAAAWNDRHRDWLAALGPRGIVVDTDALRADPEPWLARIGARLGLARRLPLQLPRGYLHPQGTEEIYALLGAPVTPELDREFTNRDAVDAGRRAEFLALLDRDLLARLGLAA